MNPNEYNGQMGELAAQDIYPDERGFQPTPTPPEKAWPVPTTGMAPWPYQERPAQTEAELAQQAREAAAYRNRRGYEVASTRPQESNRLTAVAGAIGSIPYAIGDLAAMPGQTMTKNPYQPGSEEWQFYEDARRSNAYKAAPELAFNLMGAGTSFVPSGALGMAGGKLAAPGALAAVDEYHPPFYSAVERAVQGAKQNTAPGQQWAGYLRNQPGVKPEEVEALKLGDLFSQTGAVSKQSLLDQIAANKVNVGETTFGQSAKTMDAIAKDLGYGGWRSSLTDAQKAEVNAAYDAQGARAGTKFSQYTLPGGENYREMLLTLPQKISKGETRLNEINSRLDEISQMRASEHAAHPELRDEFDRLNAERRPLMAEYQAMQANDFKSSHFDEPNILAHVRTNDRMIDGKKTLFVEEVQSDWHQKGKKQGYATDEPLKWSDPRVITSDGTKMWSANDRNGYEYHVRQDPDGKFYGIAQNVNATPQGVYTLHEAQTAAERYISHRGGGTVPDAPFKTTWPDLAMKRVIREAAEKGYDKVAWTPGSVQADRYDLSKQLKELQYLKNEDGTYQIAGTTTKGDGFNHPDNVPADKLPDVVGKEMAEKIINNEGKRARGHPSNGGYFDGVDLKIGGEGMKGFYDEILPATVNKLVKKHGGRVRQEAFDRPPEMSTVGQVVPQEGGGWKIQWDDGTFSRRYGNRNNAEVAMRMRVERIARQNTEPQQTVHTLDITPSLRAAAMKGFPLFTAGGIVAGGAMGDLAAQDQYPQP